MRQFIKRALQRLEEPGEPEKKARYDFIITASREIERLEMVMDSLPRGILVCDTAYNIILANKAARRFLSIAPYEHAKEPIWSVIADAEIAEFIAETLLSADKVEEREFDIDTNGIRRLLGVSIVPLVQNRKVSGSMVLLDDNTEKRAREAKVRRIENLASLTTLAAGIAHEIKNPLGSLSIHVQLIQKAMAAQEKLCVELRNAEKGECEPFKYFQIIDKYLHVVNEEVDRLNAIVVDFLFAVRPINAELRRGDINALIKELIEFVSFELKNARIKTVLKLAEDLPSFDFDPGLMKQALLNLVQNAIAAMDKEGTLTITTGEADGYAKITITDTGMGISEENFPKIFEPYFTTKSNGTGLGLTVVFKIIKEHQGEVSVRSREGEGTTFAVTLPIPQTDQRLITYTGRMQ